MDRREDALHKFGRRLTDLRERQKLTIAELAARSGLDPQHIIQIEAGQIDFLVTDIYALAQGLGMTPGQLLEPPG